MEGSATVRRWTPEGWTTDGGSSSAFTSDTAEAKAREAGLDADEIDGSGAGGKITVQDVKDAIEARDSAE